MPKRTFAGLFFVDLNRPGLERAHSCCLCLVFVRTFINSSEHAGDVSHLSSVQQSDGERLVVRIGFERRKKKKKEPEQKQQEMCSMPFPFSALFSGMAQSPIILCLQNDLDYHPERTRLI